MKYRHPILSIESTAEITECKENHHVALEFLAKKLDSLNIPYNLLRSNSNNMENDNICISFSALIKIIDLL